MNTNTPAHPNTRLCAYTKVDGRRCGSPAWQQYEFCWHHQGLKARFDAKQFTVPALDDANAVQVAVMDVINALITRKIDRADAYALFYGLYLAKSNLKATSLSPTPVPSEPDDLNALLERAREEGRAQAQAKAYAQGYRAGCAEIERQHAKKGEEEGESLAAYLLRELKQPLVEDEHGRRIDPETRKPHEEWWKEKKSS
jgi:hypothetical protein